MEENKPVTSNELKPFETPKPKSELVQVTYEFDALQEWFDLAKPLGLCNGCCTEAIIARSKGVEAPEIHGAVCHIVSVQNVKIPGMGSTPIALSLPQCFTHMAPQHHSSLTEGTIPPSFGGQPS